MITAVIMLSLGSCPGDTNYSSSAHTVRKREYYMCDMVEFTGLPGMEVLEQEAFLTSIHLVTVTFPWTLTHIWDGAFAGTRVRQLVLPHAVRLVPTAFRASIIRTVNIPDGTSLALPICGPGNASGLVLSCQMAQSTSTVPTAGRVTSVPVTPATTAGRVTSVPMTPATTPAATTPAAVVATPTECPNDSVLIVVAVCLAVAVAGLAVALLVQLRRQRRTVQFRAAAPAVLPRRPIPAVPPQRSVTAGVGYLSPTVQLYEYATPANGFVNPVYSTPPRRGAPWP